MLAHAMRRAIKVSLKHYKFRSSSFEFYSHLILVEISVKHSIILSSDQLFFLPYYSYTLAIPVLQKKK